MKRPNTMEKMKKSYVNCILIQGRKDGLTPVEALLLDLKAFGESEEPLSSEQRVLRQAVVEELDRRGHGPGDPVN